MAGLRDTFAKLFNSNVVVHNVKDKGVKIVDTAGVQSRNSSSSWKSGGGKFAGGNEVLNQIRRGTQGNASQGTTRRQRYQDYELMDKDAIVSAALDFYADEATVEDENGEMLGINSDHEEVVESLDNLYYDILNIEGNLRSWIREMCKFGDTFLRLDIDYESQDKLGVFNASLMNSYNVTREEGNNPEDPFEVTFKYDGPEGSGEFGYWEVGHFSLRDSGFAPYGKPILEGVRKAFKKLMMIEDAMLIHYLMRAPGRRIFKVDVGNIRDVDTYMQNVRNELKRQPIVDPDTGEYDLQFNMMNMTDDYFVPVRGQNDNSSIETLDGVTWEGMESVEYFRQKLTSGLRVPNAFMGQEQDLGGKNTLAQESIKFGNIISQVQKIVVNELTKVGIVHLFAQGIRDDRLVDFSLSLSHPSQFVEKQRLSILEEKFNLASTISSQNLHSDTWILKNIFDMSEDEIERERRRKVEDWKYESRKESITRDGEDPVTNTGNRAVTNFVDGLDSIDPTSADLSTTTGDVFYDNPDESVESLLEDEHIRRLATQILE